MNRTCYTFYMTFDDDQKRKALREKEQRADFEGKAEIQKLQREIEAAKQREERSALQRQILQKELKEQEKKSAPTKTKKREVQSSDDHVGDAKTFVETEQERQKTINQALTQAPSEEGESQG